jgi:hypothetical protein
MLLTKPHAWALIVLLTVGCTSEKHATLGREGGKPIKVTITAKTGDGFPSTGTEYISPGTKITILDKPTNTAVRVRIDEGRFAGLEASVDRSSIRDDD